MSSSSTKTDKELMWKKLSTPPLTDEERDLLLFQQSFMRGLRAGQKKGELTVIACGRQTGKSRFTQEYMKQMAKL